MKELFEIQEHTALIDTYRVALSLSFKNKRFRRVYYFILIIGSVVGLAELLMPKPDITSAIASVVMCISFPLLFFIVVIFLSTVLFYLIKPELFKADLLFNHWGMHKKTKSAEFTKQWSGFIKWEETNKFFLLFIVEHDAHIVTKKNMNEANIPEFRQFLRERIGIF